jgi:hypothetical protein
MENLLRRDNAMSGIELPVSRLGKGLCCALAMVDFDAVYVSAGVEAMVEA